LALGALVLRDGHKCPALRELAENIINPPAGFNVTDLAKISLGRGKIGMPENHFAYDLNRCPGTTRLGCSMPPEIMRADFDVDFSAGPFDNLPGTGIADWKNTFIRAHITGYIP